MTSFWLSCGANGTVEWATMALGLWALLSAVRQCRPCQHCAFGAYSEALFEQPGQRPCSGPLLWASWTKGPTRYRPGIIGLLSQTLGSDASRWPWPEGLLEGF